MVQRENGRTGSQPVPLRPTHIEPFEGGSHGQFVNFQLVDFKWLIGIA